MTNQLASNILINSQGQPRFGYFDSPITDLALKQFAYHTVMDQPASRLAKFLHFKQFQFISISHPDWQIGIAIADIRYAGNGFCYFYQRQQNILDEISIIKPFSLGLSMSQSPVQGCATIKAKQQIKICLDNYNWHLELSGPMFNGKISLHGATSAQPLAMCSPTGYNGWTYTQKHNALTISGNLSYKDQILDLNQALAGYDFSAGYMRRETSWRWGSINAQLPEGQFGLNLASGVNETGFSENVLWLNGQIQHLPAVDIQFDKFQDNANWYFNSTNNKLQLTFTPFTARQERLNLGLVISNFRQFCGVFNGVIITKEGDELILNQVPGLAENHFARW
ncbi:DUF2804 domain-containing protein [Rheinheimera sp. MMS21-TC3]|uniref:DUF2804 domain-containing protein n=1 Tax=Rheinheimera sp. MMS21-TC3 TaxID=3072790 RepID=UPI0028C449DF|nr:DUF2804 domain-containing protein [Rheinheimera sp. MMS21-TC3]WNO61589.1 DUF2804 domain-containing protein [Rheinheimera sp. MMS21-TC3]